ncbi:MAG: hypothetical protein QOD32_3067, partial [Pyrinomonadaceae bacterium]|nr:hypothetical protein [Pyrinomonadaceae bacterium]
ASGFGTSIRMVTHYDVSTADIDAAIKALGDVLREVLSVVGGLLSVACG